MRFGSLERAHKSLRVRLVFWYALFFIGTSAGVAMVSYRYLSSSLRDNRALIQNRLAHLVALDGGRDISTIEKAATGARATTRKKAFFIRVMDEQQGVIFLSTPQLWGEFDLESFDKRAPREGWQYVASRKDGDVLELNALRLNSGLWLQVGKTIADRKEILEHYRDTIIGVISGMIVLGLAGGAFLAARALRPIRDLTLATQAVIATGRMDARVPESGIGDELDKLTRLFNQMLER